MKRVFLILGLIAAALFVAILAQPASFRIERSVTIAAPPPQVKPYLQDVRMFNEWSPWMKMDPETELHYEGTPGDKGSSFSWKSAKTGEGTMRLVDPSLPGYQLEFRKPFKGTHYTAFELAEEAGNTRVTWRMSGNNNLLGKTMSLIMNPDRMIGAQFEKGLADLKKLAEEKR